MKTLQDASERICELHGSHVALEVSLSALMASLPVDVLDAMGRELRRHGEVAATAMLHQAISEHSLSAFEHDAARHLALAQRLQRPAPVPEALLLSTVPVHTFAGPQALTAATGFLFARDEQMFIVTSRHVLLDEANGHRPDRIEIEVHAEAQHPWPTVQLSLLIYRDGLPQWREPPMDGPVRPDVAAIPLEPGLLPERSTLQVFTPAHLAPEGARCPVGSALSVVGFPLGFYDTVHRLPVVRQAAVASAIEVPFQGRPCFLTDARLHRGMSGAPVVARRAGAAEGTLGYRLLGVHAARMDMGDRHPTEDETLGLNMAWSASLLLGITRPAGG